MNTPKLLLLVSCTSLITATIIVGAYHMLVQPEQIIYETQLIKATQTAEREINLSPRFQQLYTSTKPTNFISAAKDSREAVVFIRSLTKLEGGNALNRDLSSSTGSGVIISRDGYIVTNHHVIEGADIVEVTLNNNKEYIAKVVGSDIQTDMAVLKIEVDQMPYMLFGNSDSLQVGEWVLAVGNPFRLQSTVTAGIVSAKGRNIDIFKDRSGIESFIQTDAAVNPGNSGGALVNTRGELIGINTAIASQTGSYSGYSFAIPINLAKKIIADLKDYGEVKRAILGVRIQDITQELADEKGLKNLAGVYIPAVVEDGSADKAGVKEGDVILKINGIKVNKSSDLQEQISKYHPGDKVEISIMRDGKGTEITATLLSKGGENEITNEVKREELHVLGAEIENLSRDERLDLKIKHGVKITKLGSGQMKSKGIPTGFVITHIDKTPMYTTQDIENALKDKSGSVLIDGVTNDGKKEAYAIRLD